MQGVIIAPQAIIPGSIVNVIRVNPINGKIFKTKAKILENRINDNLAVLNGENVEFICAVIADDATDGCEFAAQFYQLEILSIKG